MEGKEHTHTHIVYHFLSLAFTLARQFFYAIKFFLKEHKHTQERRVARV